jgi:aquaporin Z
MEKSYAHNAPADIGLWSYIGTTLIALLPKVADLPSVMGSCLSQREVSMSKRLAAEAFGTFWLVFGGCGSAVLAAAFPQLGIGFLGVALAFGLTVLTMAFAVGHISGGHFNPAVTVGLWAGGRFSGHDVIQYIIAQVVGGIVAGAVLYVIASGKAGFDASASGFASNGYGEHSPGGYSLQAAIVAEFVLTAFFVLIIHGATDRRAPAGFAPIAIGFALTLIHLISIPVTNTSVNPARSTGVAVFQGGWALAQLWVFWVVPLIGGVAGGLTYRLILAPEKVALFRRHRAA